MAVIAAWAFPSSSSATVYETTLDEDGMLACNCPGFVFKKKGRERACKHTRQVAPYGLSLITGVMTVAEVAERLGIMGNVPAYSSPTASPAPPSSAAPTPLPQRKGRLLDFQE